MKSINAPQIGLISPESSESIFNHEAAMKYAQMKARNRTKRLLRMSGALALAAAEMLGVSALANNAPSATAGQTGPSLVRHLQPDAPPIGSPSSPLLASLRMD